MSPERELEELELEEDLLQVEQDQDPLDLELLAEQLVVCPRICATCPSTCPS